MPCRGSGSHPKQEKPRGKNRSLQHNRHWRSGLCLLHMQNAGHHLALGDGDLSAFRFQPRAHAVPMPCLSGQYQHSPSPGGCACERLCVCVCAPVTGWGYGASKSIDRIDVPEQGRWLRVILTVPCDASCACLPLPSERQTARTRVAGSLTWESAKVSYNRPFWYSGSPQPAIERGSSPAAR